MALPIRDHVVSVTGDVQEDHLVEQLELAEAVTLVLGREQTGQQVASAGCSRFQARTSSMWAIILVRGWSHTLTKTLDPILSPEEIEASLGAATKMMAHIEDVLAWSASTPPTICCPVCRGRGRG